MGTNRGTSDRGNTLVYTVVTRTQKRRPFNINGCVTVLFAMALCGAFAYFLLSGALGRMLGTM